MVMKEHISEYSVDLKGSMKQNKNTNVLILGQFFPILYKNEFQETETVILHVH